MALLMETANPAQGRLRGRTDEALIVEGRDPYYERAAREDLLYVPYGSEGQPIEERVGRHLQALQMLWEVYSAAEPEAAIRVAGLASLAELERDGLGAHLASPAS